MDCMNSFLLTWKFQLPRALQLENGIFQVITGNPASNLLNMVDSRVTKKITDLSLKCTEIEIINGALFFGLSEKDFALVKGKRLGEPDLF